jgi:integrase/recombinase XerD
MLSVYTRHSKKRPHKTDIALRRCRCPKWIQGTPSEGHEFLRTSAQTRTWQQAEAKARQLEEAARPGARKPAISIAEAVAAYRANEAGRCLAKSTTNQSKTLFTSSPACVGQGRRPHSVARTHHSKSRQVSRNLGQRPEYHPPQT